MTQWAVLNLRETTDATPAADIERDLKRRWPDVVCHFPALKQGLLDLANPMSAYVFIKAPVVPVSALERSPYASHFLRTSDTRKLQYVTDTELKSMVEPVKFPPIGARIEVIVGDWSGLEGTVVETNGAAMKVLVELWSNQAVFTIGPNEYKPL